MDTWGFVAASIVPAVTLGGVAAHLHIRSDPPLRTEAPVA